MKRFKCDSSLVITSKNLLGKKNDIRLVSVKLKHMARHLPYEKVDFPEEAARLIRDNLEFATPSRLVNQIQTLYPDTTADQVYTAWRRMSETLWKRDEQQIASAKVLLAEYPDEVDVFDVDSPEGVEQLCWGMKKIGDRLRGHIVEVGLDATCEYSTSFVSPSLLT